MFYGAYIDILSQSPLMVSIQSDRVTKFSRNWSLCAVINYFTLIDHRPDLTPAACLTTTGKGRAVRTINRDKSFGFF